MWRNSLSFRRGRAGDTARVSRFGVALALVATLTPVVLAAALPAAAARPMTRAEYEACQARDEHALQPALQTLVATSLRADVTTIDFAAVLADEWRKSSMDDLIDKRIDIAIAEVKERRSWSEQLYTLIDRAEAQKLATDVAERAWRSDAMQAAIGSLAENVGRGVGRQLEISAAEAAVPAVQCLQAFIGPQYGSAIARHVGGEAGRELALTPERRAAPISAGAVAVEGAGGIAGAIVLIMRRQVGNIAGRLGQRLVGVVLSRVVSTVAGGVGLVLIAKDLWDFRHGVLPIIEAEMKSRDSKLKVQAELATAMAEQVAKHVEEIAAEASGRVLDIWQDYKRAHAKALELAQRHPGFRSFIDTVRPERLPRLDEVIALLLASEGEDGVLKRLGDGTLHQAVNDLPAPAMEIARETRSIETAIAWHTLAGAELPRVIAFEVHRRIKPTDLSKGSLARVLALDDRVAITRVASLSPAARETLFDLDTPRLKSLARSLTEAELDTLARYLTGLEKVPRERVLAAVADSPNRMQVLASERVRDAIIASRSQIDAVDMMLSAHGLFDPVSIERHVRLALAGRVSPVLLWDKHPIVIVAGGILLLMLLLLVRRLLVSAGPRRPPPPAVQGA